MLKKIAILFLLFVIFFIYRSFFIFDKTLSSGDFPYLFLENIREFSFLPPSGSLWLTSYYQITAKLFTEYLGFSWNFAEKILWFWLFLFLSIFSSYYLTKSWLGVLIYTTNAYVLMLVGGGQMGVALAYSMAPFVLGWFINVINNLFFETPNLKFKISNLKLSILGGLILAVEMMFDPRIVYITFIAIFLYLFFTFIFNSNKKKFIARSFFLMIPVFISIVLNSFWIISLLKHGLPPEDIAKMSTLGFRFLSFADFSHSLSLLHPNWPENIFGKVYFMRAEFVILPVLAYSSLFFLKISNIKYQISKTQIKNQRLDSNRTIEQFNNQKIIFFALLGLIGAFLAKGSNPPFGEINVWLFQYFPGMGMFRDATKFYILVALSYSVLIPFSLGKISEKVGARLKIHNTYYIILATFLVFWLFSIRPAISGQLGGTFKPQVLPQEYIQLKDFLKDQPQSFKTFWIPSKQRFGFSSNAHPAISAEKYFQTNDLAEILKDFKKTNLEGQFRTSLIKYVIVPYDSQGELFIVDRKYSQRQYSWTLKELRKIPWLKQLPSIGRIVIFEV